MPLKGVDFVKLLIHDLRPSRSERLFQECTGKNGWYVISDNGSIRPCTGCFGCWVRTPGACILRDSYSEMGRLLSQSEEVVLVSRCCWGAPGPFVKNVLDRSLPYLHPFFTIRNNEMHHRLRYDHHFALSALFYGKGLSEEEMETASDWVHAVAVNFGCTVRRVEFRETPEELEGIL